jgi:hypothetical protein
MPVVRKTWTTGSGSWAWASEEAQTAAARASERMRNMLVLS